LQRIFEHVADELTAPLMKEMHDNGETLIQDQYGNYVIQHLLEKGKPEDRDALLARIRGNMVTLSTHKFASNVIEKCISFCAPNIRRELIGEILESKNEGCVVWCGIYLSLALRRRYCI
jgi:hypothetical protein